MSCVTVKVPWAPQPLACMRRSGITSRSKCANFSISQISCSKAGPRRPAVMMLVLSATGAPVALVNRVSLDMLGSWVLDVMGSCMCETSRVAAGRWCLPDASEGLSAVIFYGWTWRGLPSPGRGADHAAEIDLGEVRVLIREHVGVDVAEGRLRLVLCAGL